MHHCNIRISSKEQLSGNNLSKTLSWAHQAPESNPDCRVGAWGRCRETPYICKDFMGLPWLKFLWAYLCIPVVKQACSTCIPDSCIWFSVRSAGAYSKHRLLTWNSGSRRWGHLCFPTQMHFHFQLREERVHLPPFPPQCFPRPTYPQLLSPQGTVRYF